MEENVLPDDLYNFILNSILTILNIDNTSEDYNHILDLLKIYINKSAQEILNKTNRNIFPKALRYLVIDMACNMYKSQIAENPNSEVNQEIKSMSEAGRQVSFGTSSTIQVLFNSLVAKQLKDNEVQINRYRLLYRISKEDDDNEED